SVSFVGQLVCALILVALGFVPGYVVSYVMKRLNMLRVPGAAEMRGLDETEVRWAAYPESLTPASAVRSADIDAPTLPLGGPAAAK
ncbi:MAG: hypothetical protein RLW62_16645, partial [Gammaproteobacteria bacterium]